MSLAVLHVPTIDELAAEAAHLGVAVQRAHLPYGRRGDYSHARRLIRLNASMSDRMAIPTLMHELEHARLGHEGLQADSVEASINRTVACRLISVEEYMAAELECDTGNPRALAVCLEWPIWLIEAYQDALRAKGDHLR